MKKISLSILCAIFLSACLPESTPQVTVTPEATVTLTATSTSTATVEPTETPTPKPVVETVSEGSFWAEAGVPAGLTVTQKADGFYATNLVGQEVKVGEIGAGGAAVPADWLRYQPATEMVETENNVIPYDPAIALNVAMLYATPFAPEIQACKPGNVAATNKNPFNGKETRYSYLYWSDRPSLLKEDPKKDTRPAKIIGFFRTAYENGYQLWVKVVEWLTPGGITYTVNVTGTQLYTSDQGNENEVFPAGFSTLPESEKVLQPAGKIFRDPVINGYLEKWIETGCPPAELQNYFIYGDQGVKYK